MKEMHERDARGKRPWQKSMIGPEEERGLWTPSRPLLEEKHNLQF